ncbi:MAG: ABC transporter permease [Syntrophobacteraceae bacterium]
MQWARRQINFIDFALSSMLRRTGKNLALLLVYSTIVFLLSSVMFFSISIRNEALSVLDATPEIVVQKMMAGRHEIIPHSYAEEIGKIRGVGAVRSRLWGYYYHPGAEANYTLMVPAPSTLGDDEVSVGHGVLRTWPTHQGDEIILAKSDGGVVALNVTRLLDAETELVSSDLILTTDKAFREITGMPEGYATDLSVSVRNPEECTTIAKKIRDALPDSRPIIKGEILRSYATIFDWRGGYVIVLLSGAVLAFFIFGMEKATGLSAEEKREIGILKAVGWTNSDVLILKFWEGSIVSLTAFILGVLAAYGHVFFLSASLFEHAIKGWGILYPSFRLHPSVDAYHMGALFLLAVVPYALVTVIPVWKTSVTDPDLVMRQ